MKCQTKLCPNRPRPQPGALFCQECHDAALARIERSWHRLPRPITADEVEREHTADLVGLGKGKVVFLAPQGPLPSPPTTGIFDGTPNVTCPACTGRYHYGAPAPFMHMCPLCSTWLCWEETDETREVARRVARKCPVCDKFLQEKSGKYGPWWGCTWVRKGHRDNCAGRRKWADCDTVTETKPRLRLVVWEPHVWTEMDQRAEDQARLYDRVEGFEAWLAKVRRVKGRG